MCLQTLVEDGNLKWDNVILNRNEMGLFKIRYCM